MNQCQHGNDPEDCPSCNRQPTDAPTPERPANLRCKITGNSCGTDTWRVGQPCQCENCQRWLKSYIHITQILTDRPTDPTPEALEWLPRISLILHKAKNGGGVIACAEEILTCFDTFAKAAVERERERCVKIANNNVFLAAQAEPQSTAANWCARITAAIVNGEAP